MPGVLIAGGGPVGLSLAVRLAQLDVPVTLAERHPGTARFPKGRALSVRSMEIYRAWGLEDAITAAGLPRDQLAFYTGTTLTDPAGTRIVTNPTARPLPSPTHTLLCSQDRLEPLLREHAERLAPGRIHFGAELTGFTADTGGVTATLTGDPSRTGRFDYLVGADGARSLVRDHLGIAMTGPADVSHNLNILFTADLAAHVADRRCAVYTITRQGPDSLHGAFLAVDNDRRWLFNIVADGTDPGFAGYDDRTCVELIRTAAGLPDLPVTLLERQVWRAGAQVADRFQASRVFLAGDAAHITTPYGGFGLNCGIADADNLAWKLAAVHHGHAGPALLDTYEPERRPVALASAQEGHRRLLDAITAHRAGAPPTARPSEGLVLGYHYTSGAVIPDGTDPPAGDPVADYTPTARPGHRAPHLWIERNGRRMSTLDLLGPDLTLLAGPDARWADDAPAPITAHHLDGRFTDAYGISPAGAVLVRPDGHVAWRSPGTPGRTLDEVAADLLAGSLQRP